jgi:hypothetical protein
MMLSMIMYLLLVSLICQLQPATGYRWTSSHLQQQRQLHPTFLAKKDWSPPSESAKVESSDNGSQGYAYAVELPRSSGISWSSDLSFRWIYVQSIEPSSPAAASGLIEKGDFIIGVGNTSTIAKDFLFVLNVRGSLKLTVPDLKIKNWIQSRQLIRLASH